MGDNSLVSLANFVIFFLVDSHALFSRNVLPTVTRSTLPLPRLEVIRRIYSEKPNSYPMISFQCRPIANLVPMDLPFYDCHQTLLEPMELPAVISGVKSPCKVRFFLCHPSRVGFQQAFSFDVPREPPLPRFEIQLRFFQVPPGYNSQELADDFPLNCMVRVEDQAVQLPAVIPTNKPNVEPKRPSRPVDITQHCLNVRDPTRPLRLVVEWTGDKRVWAVGIYLVSSRSHTMILGESQVSRVSLQIGLGRGRRGVANGGRGVHETTRRKTARRLGTMPSRPVLRQCLGELPAESMNRRRRRQWQRSSMIRFHGDRLALTDSHILPGRPIALVAKY
ncbi:unnamed protein product [Heligmosomoides polygyrus]|uniref:PINIT domain-containing protein n=1 Tax=Heligmosomoides polygyrus TaxID=6339 RepID=A0A183G0X3_HELPZ|nr:unnamed protein product [Heligmosomoides polygyrus]